MGHSWACLCKSQDVKSLRFLVHAFIGYEHKKNMHTMALLTNNEQCTMKITSAKSASEVANFGPSNQKC